jgi:hypothetical protein
MNWAERYASKYDDGRREYMNRFVYKGLKDTQAAKDFYRDHVAPHKPKPPVQTPAEAVTAEVTPQDEQLSFDGMPTSDFKGMDPSKAILSPHYLGPGWTH